MDSPVELLIQLSRKSLQGASFKQTAHYAEQALPLAEGRQWLEVQKLRLGAFRELKKIKATAQVHAELLFFLKTAPVELHSLNHYLLAQTYEGRGEKPVARKHAELALEAALISRHGEDLSLSLFAVARLSFMQGDLKRTDELTEKLETVLQIHPKLEISFSLVMLKAQILMQKKQSALALQEYWRAYELAKKSGAYYYIPFVLSSLATVYVELGSYSEAQSYLKLAEKGITDEEHPNLYGFLKYIRARLEKSFPESAEFDLVVDLGSKSMREKQRGTVDFKNQHTLLELALLLMRTPRKAFSKEELMKLVWNKAYDPVVHDNLIYVTIKRLRTLIEPEVAQPRYILRNRQGYYFNDACRFRINEEKSA